MVTVQAIKEIDRQKIAVLDSGINVLGSPHEEVIALKTRKETSQYRLIGPLCFPSDCIARRIVLPMLETGDKLLILNCGAYTISNSWQFIKTRPPVFLIQSNGVSRIIRRKEELEDMTVLDQK